MGTKELRKRNIWQDLSGEKAVNAEKTFFEVFEKEFKGSDFEIMSKPKLFNNIYSGIVLDEEILKEIYTPEGETWRHGLLPDYAIINKKTKKILFVEVKRQDGWVEGKERKAGRGNAHERS